MPLPNDALFTAADLGDWLHKSVVEDSVVMAERVVWGWLRPILGVTTRPTGADLSPELVAWALELGGIAYENPAGLTSKQIGPFQEQYSAERRAAILDEVATGGQPAAAAMAPRGRFPKASRYPDPADGCSRRW